MDSEFDAIRSSKTEAKPPRNAQERQIQQYLERGQWRHARDLAKQLCKIDRPRYLPLLIQANMRLAQEMLSKNRIKEARQIVEYLRTIAYPETIRKLEVELEQKSVRDQKTVEELLHDLAHRSEELTPEGRQDWIDRCVTRFQAPKVQDDKAAHQLGEELASIHRGFERLAEENYDGVLDAVRPLPGKSIFNPWRQYLKGVAAYYRGDIPKAERFLGDLPSDSATARAAAPYRVLMQHRPGVNTTKLPWEQVEPILELMDLSNLAKPLRKANEEWQKGHPKKSYQTLKEAWPHFPSDAHGLMGVLTEFFFKASGFLDSATERKFLEHIDYLAGTRKYRNKVELKWILRTLGISAKGSQSPEILTSYWRDFIDALNEVDGEDGRRNAIAYHWLGKNLAQMEGAEPPKSLRALFYGPSKTEIQENRRLAIQTIECALEEDPDLLDAYLELTDLYEKCGKKRERNRLLDTMTTRFPQNKAVLLQAGKHCVERKAYVKGLDYLLRAYEQDQLDPEIPKTLVQTRARLGTQYFQKRNQLKKARETWDKLEPLLKDAPDDLSRARWIAHTQRGMLEALFGSQEESTRWLTSGEQASPSNEAFQFLRFAVLRHNAAKQSTQGRNEIRSLRQNVKQQSPSPQKARTLLELYGQWNATFTSRDDREIHEWLNLYLKEAAKQRVRREDVTPLTRLISPGSPLVSGLRQLIDAVLKHDRNDPLFRIHRMFYSSPSELLSSNPGKQLESIIKEATKRGDKEALELAQSADNMFRFFPESIFFGGGPQSMDWLDDIEDDDDFF